MTWRPIREFEGLYEVSDTGLVFSVRRNCCLKQSLDRYGYPKIVLSRNGNPIIGLCIDWLPKLLFQTPGTSLPSIILTKIRRTTGL